MLIDKKAGTPSTKSLNDVSEMLRRCATCGMCTATCPTYLLSNDENDSPRGRNKIVREIFESGNAPTQKQTYHLERCLSCFSCTTTCPSGVGYKNLIDWARFRIDQDYKRSWLEGVKRKVILEVLPNTALFSASLKAAPLVSPIKPLLPKNLKPMLELIPKQSTAFTTGVKYKVYPAQGTRKFRVSMLAGCVQPVLNPEINEATIRLLNRHQCEVVIAHKSQCCGALYDHLGKEEKARAQAITNVAAWTKEMEQEGLDAVIINASGCGSTVKDYGHILSDDPVWGERAAKIAGIAKDITEFLMQVDLKPQPIPKLKVAYHSACSLQHVQKVTRQPKHLLEEAGFKVLDIPEGYLCCGSAGTYNIFQSEMATQLRDRKVKRIHSIHPDLVAGGNIGCIVQLSEALEVPMVHTVELLDWATGGPLPESLSKIEGISHD